MLGWLCCFHLVSSFRRFSRRIFFTGWGCQSHGQPPNLEDQGIPFSLGHHLDLSDMGGPTSSHITASIALQNHLTTQAPPLCQSTDTFCGRQRGGGRGLLKHKILGCVMKLEGYVTGNENVKKHYIYTGCFTTLGHNCRKWFPRSLWSKKFI